MKARIVPCILNLTLCKLFKRQRRKTTYLMDDRIYLKLHFDQIRLVIQFIICDFYTCL